MDDETSHESDAEDEEEYSSDEDDEIPTKYINASHVDVNIFSIYKAECSLLNKHLDALFLPLGILVPS